MTNPIENLVFSITDAGLCSAYHGELGIGSMCFNDCSERAQSAVEGALAAFWLELASRYPEVNAGDLVPGADLRLKHGACEAAVAWVETNMPKEAHDE